MNLPEKGGLPEGRILGIDFGERRIGVAISDPLHITAQGLKTIAADRRGSHFNVLRELIREYDVALVVIGMPYSLAGKDTAIATEKVRNFVEELQKNISIPVAFIDERLSSVEAKRALVEMGYRTGHKKELVDRVAAIFLLQTYMDRNQRDR